jgi:hypothetical protein
VNSFWDRKRVLSFAREAGGADAIGPVLKSLADSGAACKVLASGPAIERFKTQNIPIHQINSYSDGNIEELCLKSWGQLPDIVFTSAASLPNLDMTERHLWKWSRSRKLPAAALVDQWQNYAIRFSGTDLNERLAFQPDRIIVMDEIARSEARAEGLPDFRLRVGGQPAFEAFRQALDKNRISHIREELASPLRGCILLFVAESLRKDFNGILPYDEFTTLQLLIETLNESAKNAAFPPISLAIKLHPQNSRTEFDDSIRPAGFPVHLFQFEEHAVNLIGAADVVLGMSSVLLIHSMVLQKPTVCLELGAKGNSQFIGSRIGAVPSLRDPQTAKENILRLIADPDERQRHVVRQSTWQSDWSKSVWSILQHLEQLLKEHTA